MKGIVSLTFKDTDTGLYKYPFLNIESPYGLKTLVTNSSQLLLSWLMMLRSVTLTANKVNDSLEAVRVSCCCVIQTVFFLTLMFFLMKWEGWVGYIKGDL